MEPQSIRMPSDLWEEIRSEAERQDRTAAEHIRLICRRHLEADVQELHGRVDKLDARLDSLEDLEARVDRLESLEDRVDELESAVETGASSGGSGGTAAAGGETGTPEAPAEGREAKGPGGQQGGAAPKAGEEAPAGGTAGSPSGGTRGRQANEPVESVDGVIRAAAAEYGEDAVQEMLPAGQAALEALEREGRVPEERLRRAIAREFATTDRPEAWWAEHVQPLLDVAAKWGLVVAHSDGDLEWVGSP